MVAIQGLLTLHWEQDDGLVLIRFHVLFHITSESWHSSDINLKSLQHFHAGGSWCIYCFLSLGCIPWPCFDLLGEEDPKLCQHYVQAPNDVKVEFVQEPNPKSDTIVVSWKPSHYGTVQVYTQIHMVVCLYIRTDIIEWFVLFKLTDLKRIWNVKSNLIWSNFRVRVWLKQDVFQGGTLSNSC